MGERYSVTAVLSAVDRNFSSVMQKASDSMAIMKSKTGNMTKSTSEIGGSITGLIAKMAAFAGGAALMGSAVSRFDTLNKYPIVMKGLGYSASDANKSVKTLSNGIDGLPTSLDGITNIAQQLAPLTGGANSAAKSAVALNNAFLASGASVSDTSRGLQQYTQMLATGKVDLMSWRTLQETMPIALRKVAGAFGLTGKSAENDLFKKLQSGEITMDQLNDKFVELNKGQNGFASLAKKNSAGIATSFANLKTAAVKGVANMISAIDDGFQNAGLPKIATMIDSLKGVINAAFTAMGNVIVKVVPPIVNFVKSIIVLYNTNPWFKTLANSVMIFVSSFIALRVAKGILDGVAKSVIKLGIAMIGAIIANPWLALIAAIVAVGAALWAFFTKTEQGKAMWQSFSTFLIGLWNAISPALIATWNTLSTAFSSIWQSLVTIIQPIIQTIITIFTQLLPILMPILQGITLTVIAAFTGIVTGIVGALGVLTTVISGALSVIAAVWSAIWNSLSAIVNAAFTIVRTVISTAMAVIKGVIALTLAVISGNWRGAWNAIKGIASAVWNGIKAIISSVLSVIKTIISSGINVIKSIWNAGINSLKSVVIAVWNTIKSVFSAGVAFIKSVVHVDLGAAGEAIMNSLLNGLKRAWEGVKSFVGGIAGWIKDHKGPISYDRRLLIPHGKAIMLGFNEGLMEQFSSVKSNVSSMAGQIANSIQNATPVLDTKRISDGFDRIQSLTSSTFSGSVNGSMTLNASTMDQQNNALLRRIADKDTNLYMDSDTLVGTTSDKFDGQLGATSNNNERWSW
ncbi:tape measure protein [Pediococcus pentosaceus]|uniref:tape measure protein n=1 Tax=Pediococcus pentosaceus TaxID=1255 RepID=UPI002B4C0324|nr:tape measure protein [Pediococcus pentosaceus]MEB3377160.1 tape measure protein [Pediococcus pentosaceus]